MSDTRESIADQLGATPAPAAEAPAADAPAAETSAPQPPQQEQAPLREQQLDKYGRAYATGRRKDRLAVRITRELLPAAAVAALAEEG